MRTLTLRIYLTVVAVLLLFAFASGWMFQHHMEQERVRAESVLSDRMAAWGDLIQRSLPGADAPPEDQAAALREWSQRLRLPLALDSVGGERIGASESFLRRQSEGIGRGFPVRLEDGRTLWVMRPGLMRGGPPGSRPLGAPPGPTAFGNLPFMPVAWQRGIGLVVILVLLFFAVAAGAWPVVRRLTSRLDALKRGMEVFGAGELSHRVEVSGRDEVAAVAASFNIAAARIETLVRSHQSLLANASHELRSPLARMKMAVALLEDAAPEQRERLKSEIGANIAELDALVEEVLLASRLDALRELEQRERVDLLGLAAEEAARVDASLEGAPLVVTGDERLLRRALRNLLENAKRYGGDDVSVSTERAGTDALVRVCDRGPGVPEPLRERIFEPFYRLPGHAEKSGGVGLGLSLVKQIAERHGGHVRCEARDGGGSCFVIALPQSA
ncbi:HAMP domain-containing sensor histidine kinase [Piscinibacter sp.]|jgi:signal transduction histidine kinase|uniref:HAMP domain-containing sensor histidine kinase n=1 Tax=Piscinibacter sp. TaxID=1903157 RepID=UPI002F3E2880